MGVAVSYRPVGGFMGIYLCKVFGKGASARPQTCIPVLVWM